MTADARTMTRLIRHRRTMKPGRMSDRPVADEIVWELLENANWAPTHGMTEPWRFTVFTGEARQALAQLLPGVYRQITPVDQFKQRKYDDLAANPLRAPVVISIAMKRQTTEKISEIDELAAVACAVQNMHLTAAAYGIGGFWSSNAAVCSQQMHELLGLDVKDRVLGLFYLGYPADEWPTSERNPMQDKVTWRHA